MIQGTGYRVQGTENPSGMRRLWQKVAGLLIPVACILTSACSSAPPPPDWKIDAQGLLEGYGKHYLDGNGPLAERNFAKARAEIARTARLDLAAKAELIRCAFHTAALDFTPCTEYDRLSTHASDEDAAYDRFLTGDWQGLETGRLPAQYRELLAAKDDVARSKALEGIRDPVSRAIAAGVLLRTERAAPEVIAAATRNASEQGWRRPLLAWLEVQAKRAEATGDRQALDLVRQRIELLMGSVAPGK